MTDTQRRDDWVHFFNSSQPSYKPWALESCLTNDGEKMLSQALKALKIERTADLVKMITGKP